MFLPTSLGTKEMCAITLMEWGILTRSASPCVHEHFLAGVYGLVAQIPNHPWLVIYGRIMDAGEYQWKDMVPKQPWMWFIILKHGRTRFGNHETFMDGKEKKKKKKQSSPRGKQLWEGGGTKGYLTLHMNLWPPMNGFSKLQETTDT